MFGSVGSIPGRCVQYTRALRVTYVLYSTQGPCASLTYCTLHKGLACRLRTVQYTRALRVAYVLYSTQGPCVLLECRTTAVLQVAAYSEAATCVGDTFLINSAAAAAAGV
jgi:hypothetical protein